jgi:D-cysteine desulfhydrase
LPLGNLPTPLWRNDALDALVGTRVWVKRDDMSAGAEAGNKIRKLAYLLADAQQHDAHVVITCGGFQSNHARATAILAASLGMRAVLLLRVEPSRAARPDAGNAFLDALVGAEVRHITPAQYAERNAHMQAVADELRAKGERAYVIPEGGSNGLGAFGYVHAMAEVRAQLDQGALDAPKTFDAVVHGCGSGGTAAGVALGAARHDIAAQVLPVAVCDDRAHFENVIAHIIDEARVLDPALPAPRSVTVLDAWKGPAYGVASPEQLRFIVRLARASGLVLDPVYSGKALYALAQMPDKPARALFIHTGGLPGLLAQTEDFEGAL